MKKLTIIVAKRLLFLTLLAASLNSLSQSKVITPEGFNWMSKASVNMVSTYRNYQDFIRINEPKFLFDVNTIQTFDYGYVVPTSLGNIGVGPIHLELGAYFRWQIKDNFKIGFFAFANTLDLQIDDVKHADLTSSSGTYGNLYGWQSGKIILAVNPQINENVNFSIGALLIDSPFVTISDQGTEQFDIYYDDEFDEYLTNNEREELFFMGKFYGYEIGTFFELKEKVLSLVDLKRVFSLGEGLGDFGVGFRHYNFQKTYQVGIEYKNPSLFSTLPIHFEAYWNILSNNRWNEIGFVNLSTGKSFLKDKSEEFVKKDFYITVNTGLSYSRELFDEGLFGYQVTAGGVASAGARVSISSHDEIAPNGR
jgi:hypothetical protein